MTNRVSEVREGGLRGNAVRDRPGQVLSGLLVQYASDAHDSLEAESESLHDASMIRVNCPTVSSNGRVSFTP